MLTANPAYVGWYGHRRRQNWRTPRSLFDPLHAEYGFTMDGASEPGNAVLPKASTIEAPLPWDGERVFCNPPWSNISPFIELASTAELAVLLVPARTNVRWFHRALELRALPRFFAKRPRFENAPDGNKGHNSPVDCLLLVFNRVDKVRNAIIEEIAGHTTMRSFANGEFNWCITDYDIRALKTPVSPQQEKSNG